MKGPGAERLDGSASLSITDANVILEGGMPTGATGSWLVSARRTSYDLVASRVADQEFPRFADVQAKGVWELAPGRTVSALWLRSRQDAALDIDSDDARGEFNDNTNNDLASVRLDATIGSTGRSHTIVAYSDNSSAFGVNAAFENRSQRANTPDDDSVDVANVIFDRTLSLRDVSLRQELDWTLGAHVVEAGGELHRLSTELSFDISGDRNPNAVNGSSQQGGAGLPDSLRSLRDVTRGGMWLLDRWQATPALALEAGVRIDRSGVNRDTQLSPRVSATWSLDSRTRLRTALGRYTQSPGLREARAERLRSRLDGRPGRPPPQRAGRAAIGGHGTRRRRRRDAAHRGLLQDVVAAAGRPPGNRSGAAGSPRRVRLSRRARFERAGGSDHHVDADQRRPRARVRLRRVRLAHDRASEMPGCAVGRATHGDARHVKRTGASIPSSTIAVMRSRRSFRTA